MEKKPLPVFEYSLCIACGICGQTCPFGAIAMQKKGLDAINTAFPEIPDEAACKRCGVCAKQCPASAIG